MQKCGSRSRISNAIALAFNPLVSKILLKRSAVKRFTANDRKQRKKLLAAVRRNKIEKQRILEEKRQLAEERKLLRERATRSNYKAYHRTCGHAYLKNLINFKRKGKAIASRLPSKFLSNYRKECAVCLAMKKRRKSLPPKRAAPIELASLALWGRVLYRQQREIQNKKQKRQLLFHCVLLR